VEATEQELATVRAMLQRHGLLGGGEASLRPTGQLSSSSASGAGV
jgi:hypothetical protein